MSARTPAAGRAGFGELGFRSFCCIHGRDSSPSQSEVLRQIVAPWATCRMSRLRNRNPFDFGLNAKIHVPFSLRSIGANIPRAVFATSLRCSRGIPTLVLLIALEDAVPQRLTVIASPLIRPSILNQGGAACLLAER